MPRDIVERLRDRAYSGLPDPLLAEAADEIVRLRGALMELGSCVRLAESGEGSTYAIRTTACDAECAIERLRAWVNELQLSKVEIDALRRVVENGRFVDMYDYGLLRSLLVRLRPEWEGADRSQPVKDAEAETLARMFHGEYERRAEELGYETRPDTRRFDPKSINGRLMVATCRAVMERISPQPTLTDAEREAVEFALDRLRGTLRGNRECDHADTLRGLLERLG